MADTLAVITGRRAALAAMIANAQRVLRTAEGRARFPGALWGDQVWHQSVPGREPPPVCFVASLPPGNGATLVERLGKLGVATWPVTFADPIRAYLVVLPDLTRSKVEYTMVTARHFWRFLGASGRHDGDAVWTWDLLNDATLAEYRAYLGAAAPLGAGLTERSADKPFLTLRQMGETLYARGACAPLTYAPKHSDLRARTAAMRRTVVLPTEATGLVAGVVTPRHADAAKALVRDAKRRWESDSTVRERWAPGSWDSIVWAFLAGVGEVSRSGGVVWSAEYVPKHIDRTPELVGAYGVAPYPSSYGDLLRAFLLDRGELSPGSVWTYTGLWRRFYRFLCDAGLSTVDAPWHWGMVTDAQLIGFGAYLRAGYGTETGLLDPMTPQMAAMRVMDLRSVCDWLGTKGAAPALTVVRLGDELRVQDGVLAPASALGHRAKNRAVAAAARVRLAAPAAPAAPDFEPRLARVVEKGVARLATSALRDRHPGAEWEHTSWRAVGGGESTTIVFGQVKGGRRSLAADVLDLTGIDPWPTWYGDPVRAMITERTMVSPARLQALMSACRNFWRFLVASKRHTAEKPWSWSHLDDRVLGRYEQYLQEHVGRSSATLVDASVRGNIDAMMSIGRWFAGRRVIKTPRYMPVSASATARWRDEDEQRRAGAALLPPRGSLEALSRLYYEITHGTLRGKLNAVDEACVLLLVLLMLTGRRLGELLRLRAACLLYETVRPWQDG